MSKVLIMTVSAGGGHNSAARALEESLRDLNCDTVVIDALKFVSPMLDRIVSGGYEKSAKYAPKTFGALYRLAGGKSSKEDLDVLMRGMIGRKIFRLVQDTDPDAIIGTHPFPLMAIMKYKERGVIDAPILSVITDYTAHPAYMQKNIDAYITGDSDVSYVLKNSGIPGEKIYSYGIPISKDFLDTRSINTVREQLALEDKFTVLLMGGSFGAGNIKANLVELINSSYDFQIVVVTGRDHALKDKLEKLVKELNTQKSVHILGYTEDMPELLSIGNVLVTKPGGLTTTEAIIKGIPMVIPYYIPGQEQENVDFLLNNGLAIKTSKNYPLSTIIEMLMDSPWRMEEIAERMTRRRKTDSARKVAELAVDLIEKSESKARKPGY